VVCGFRPLLGASELKVKIESALAGKGWILENFFDDFDDMGVRQIRSEPWVASCNKIVKLGLTQVMIGDKLG